MKQNQINQKNQSTKWNKLRERRGVLGAPKWGERRRILLVWVNLVSFIGENDIMEVRVLD